MERISRNSKRLNKRVPKSIARLQDEQAEEVREVARAAESKAEARHQRALEVIELAKEKRQQEIAKRRFLSKSKESKKPAASMKSKKSIPKMVNTVSRAAAPRYSWTHPKPSVPRNARSDVDLNGYLLLPPLYATEITGTVALTPLLLIPLRYAYGEETPNPRRLDLVFCLDCTGSMSSVIKSCQDNIASLTNTIISSEGLDVRTCLIPYRDHYTSEEYCTKVYPFTRDTVQLQKNINEQSAGGGGDTPEAVTAAMFEALCVDWREVYAMYILIEYENTADLWN